MADDDLEEVVETEEAPLSDDDLMAELGATYDEVTAEPEEAPEEVAEEVVETTTERPRGPDGKFVKVGEEAPEMAAPAEEIQPDAPVGEEAVAEEPEEVIPAVVAPASWTEEAKAKWSELAPELQQTLVQQEAARAEADEQKNRWFQEMTPIAQALQPVAQQLQLSGVQPGAYVQQLVAADQYLRSDPQAALKWIAQQYGATLPATDDEEGFGEYQDPQLAPVVDTVTQLQNELQALKAQQEQAQTQQLSSELEAFSQDKPHFEAVRHQMGDLIQAGVAKDLQAAYDMAVWANPNTRTAMLAEQAKPTAEVVPIQPKEDAAKRAATAKRIAATNLRTTGTAGGSPAPHQTTEEELGAVYDSMQGQ